MVGFVSALGGLYLPEGRAGQGLVEYALILVLVAIVSIVTLGLLGGTLNDLYYSRISNTLSAGGM
jgi:Flp pilus assembly pilin Flp